jgi:hypothetical protein
MPDDAERAEISYAIEALICHSGQEILRLPYNQIKTPKLTRRLQNSYKEALHNI